MWAGWTKKLWNSRDDLHLPEGWLLNYGKEKPPMLNYCITMFNESYIQLMQSLAGVYRSYYELVGKNEQFMDRCHVFIIADGYEKLSDEFLINWEQAGIFNEYKTKRFRNIEIDPGTNQSKHSYKNLKFINTKTMNDKIRVYGTNNIVHTFSRFVYFNEFLKPLSEQIIGDQLTIDNYSIHDFLLGDDRAGNVKENKFFHLPMPIHFCIKHRNQGKIESYKWFFKGFWEYMQPKYCQMIDVGSIPLWNSISYIIMHMEAIKQVGGACGEIEVLIPEKKEDGQPINFMESVMLRAQYVEYKLSHYLDKSIETLFGFVSVLPGAFSTFRWECIDGAPIDEFLKGSKDEFGDMTHIMPCSDANKYLAEDRLMWLEIVAKKKSNWIIHYVPGWKCLTGKS
jgi:cellulose synthase/poly-beta-1,6-N-acetylglucosamine synthase-like glycosyltransferase